MKTSVTLLAAVFLIIALSSCLLVAAPAATSMPPTLLPSLTPSPFPLANTLEVTSVPPATSAVSESPYNENAAPADDIANALAESEKDGKLVLLDFGANWCPDCVVLSTLFEDPAVKPFLEENFRVVSIDVGYWDKNLDISEKYDNPIANGIPAVVVLAPSGEMIASTKDGALANARTATAQDILAYLQTWLAQKP
jgi:thiol-disulfide isomerase/thioredoxin